MWSHRCKTMCIINNILVFRVIFILPVSFQELNWVSYKGDCPSIYSFDDITADVFDSFFFLPLLVWLGPLPVSPTDILYFKHLDSFFICLVYPIRYLAFLIFHDESGTFPSPNSIPISWLYILIFCITKVVKEETTQKLPRWGQKVRYK